MSGDLPAGFILDQPSPAANAPPPGFELDHPSLWEDAAKSTAAGLGNATIDTLGMVGDARSLLSKGVDALGNKIGVDLSPVKTAAGYSPLGVLNAAPTSAQVKSVMASDPIVSPDYQPQSALGGVLKTGAEFLPGMVDPELAGPAALKAAGKLFLTRVAAPAVASETAGALTKGTEAEPYARARRARSWRRGEQSRERRDGSCRENCRCAGARQCKKRGLQLLRCAHGAQCGDADPAGCARYVGRRHKKQSEQ